MPNPLAAIFRYFSSAGEGASVSSTRAHTGRLFVLSALVSVLMAVYPVVSYEVRHVAPPKELLDYIAQVVFWFPATFAGVYAVRQGMSTVVELKGMNGGGNGGSGGAGVGTAQGPTG